MRGFNIVRFEKYSMYFLSIIMALGTINPFNLAGSTREQAVQSLWIYPAIFFIFFSYGLDRKAHNFHIRSIKICMVCLFMLLFTTLFSDSVYHIVFSSNIYPDISFYIKLIINFFSYYVIAILLIRTKDLNNNLLIYSITMLLIVLPFLLHLNSFSKCFEFSNGRLWMYGENPNTFSARLCIAIVYFTDCISKHKYNKYIRVLFGLGSLLLIYFVVLSGSRGSLAILVLSLVYLVIRDLPLRKIIMIIIPIVMLSGFLIIKFVNTDQFVIIERFASLSSKGDEREELMDQAVEIWELSPILGCGENGYKNERISRFNEIRDSHCIATSILAMSGIMGLLCFSGFVLVELKSIIKILRVSALPMILFVFILLMALKTGGVITYFFMYYMFGWCLAYSYLIQKK